MRHGSLVLLMVVGLSCGGDESKSKDWSEASLLERAIDFCIKHAACNAAEGSIAACLEATADLQALPANVPTRRDLQELVDLRECYNRSLTCGEVQACAGVPEAEDPRECTVETYGASCRYSMGVSVLKHCVNGLVVELDCTKLGLTCAFDSQNHNSCVGETCSAADYTPTCDEETGDLNTCGEIGATSPGTVVYQYACGAIGMGCALDLGDPATPGDEFYTCIGKEEACDPAADAPVCEDSTLALCQQNLDGSGNMARFDCASGAIHHTCDATAVACAPTTTTCDPAADQGSCDGSNLIICVDGTIQTIDCQEHGLKTCRPGTPSICANSRS